MEKIREVFERPFFAPDKGDGGLKEKGGKRQQSFDYWEKWIHQLERRDPRLARTLETWVENGGRSVVGNGWRNVNRERLRKAWRIIENIKNTERQE